jgi:hypothetical protein
LEINFPAHSPIDSRLESIDSTLLFYPPQTTNKSQPILGEKIKISLENISANIFLFEKLTHEIKVQNHEVHNEKLSPEGKEDVLYLDAIGNGKIHERIKSEIMKDNSKNEKYSENTFFSQVIEESADLHGPTENWNGGIGLSHFEGKSNKSSKFVKLELNGKKKEKSCFFSFTRVHCEIIKPGDEKIAKERGWEFKDHKKIRLQGCKFYENQVNLRIL